MRTPRLLICDLGGTLRVFQDPEQEYPTGTEGEWALCPGVAIRVSQHVFLGGYLGIATNQPYISTGETTRALVMRDIGDVLARAITSYTQRLRILAAMGCGSEAPQSAEIYPGIAICPHQPEAHCPCRKPSPYMLLTIAEWYYRTAQITLGNILYIGDALEDREAASRASMQFMWAQEYFYAR
jgi:phosphoglycolate phosphatase-like HAD superfamily hydrolase